VYGSRLVTSLMPKWQSMNMQEIAVSFVMAHATQIDTRLQRLLYTTTIKTRSEMQQQIKAYAFAKRTEHSGPDLGPERKKLKMQGPTKYHYCGKLAICRDRTLIEYRRAYGPRKRNNQTTTTTSVTTTDAYHATC